MQRITSDQLAQVILKGNDAAMEFHMAWLRSEPVEVAAPILVELAHHRDPQVRGWASWGAASVLGRDAVPLLLALARDRDADVRDIAVTDLLDVDPTALEILVPSLRKQLRSKDYYAPISAAWTLARLGDSGSADAIEELSRDDTRDLWQRLATSVIVTLLREGSSGVVTRVRAHEHGSMQWLVTAAQIADTSDAYNALLWLAESDTDDECRRLGRLGAAQMSNTDPRGDGGTRSE